MQISSRGQAIKHYQDFKAKASKFFKFFLEIIFSQKRKTMTTYLTEKFRYYSGTKGGQEENRKVKIYMWHNERVIDSHSHL